MRGRAPAAVIGGRSPEDAQAGVLLALAAPAADQQPAQHGEHDEGERREEHGEPGRQQAGPVGVERERARGLVVQSPADPQEEGPRRDEAEDGARRAHDHPGPDLVAAVGEGSSRRERTQCDGQREQRVHRRAGVEDRVPAASCHEVDDRDQGDDRDQERPALEEREVGALEVDPEVSGGQRADEQDGEERADADRRGDAGTLQEVEQEVHVVG